MVWIVFFSSVHWMLNFANTQIEVEVVTKESEKSKGLSGREELQEGKGMLFIYENKKILSFWMKDMKIPISIAFFDENQKLINFEEMSLPDPDKKLFIYRSEKPAKYALELPSGWFKAHPVKKGERFRIVN